MEQNIMQLYHGSNVCVESPRILTNGHYKDFGFGFYCTNYEHQAKKWALTRKKNHIVNVYEYSEMEALAIQRFTEMTEEWLDFIVNCRRGVEHGFDIVEGPMADDTILDYIEDYVRGTITRDAFWVLVKFKYPTHQIVFCTERALGTLRYERSYQV